MPKTKTQGYIFGIFMSFFMTFGMEVYNEALRSEGGLLSMTNDVLLGALKGTSYMAVIVFVISELYGNKVGAALADKHFSPRNDNPYLYRLSRQAFTVAIMCPSMSLVATILFNYILGGAELSNFFAIWLGTFMRNVPMAFFWLMFVAAPLSHACFDLLFAKKNAENAETAKAKRKEEAVVYSRKDFSK